MKLSKNFDLVEFTKSPTAIRKNINNAPTKENIDNLTNLCFFILQPLRDAIGMSIDIVSGFRNSALNKAVGGTKDSSHMRGEAADIELWINGKEETKKLFFKIIELNLPFDTMIWEFGDVNKPDWVHIAYVKGSTRRRILRAYKTKDIWGNLITKYEDITTHYIKH